MTMLDQVMALGFDRSAPNEADGNTVHVRCSQCEALVINGLPSHEHGCPNQPVECRECGELIPRGESCTCRDEVLDDIEEES